MLLLSRRPSEAIRIGDDITVTVLAVRGQQVLAAPATPDGNLILFFCEGKDEG